LPASQVGLLFDLVRGLRNQGLSVLYVSHRLGEIFELADRATVLREGRTVGTWPVAELDRDRLVSLMVAPPPVDAPETIAVSPPAAPQPLRPRTQAPRDDAVLEVADVQSTELRGLGFRLFAGEILGFAGLIGSGQEELPYILAGAGRVRSGTLRTSGATVELTRLRPRKAIQLGIGMVPANRAVEGLIGRFSILANMTLPRVRSFQRHGAISGRAESAFVAERMQALDVVPRDANRMVQLLSGGNAQKVVLAKWLGVSTSALVLAEPTAGVDVATRPIIYELLRELADGGLGIVVCSTDTSELAELCTRVVVLRDGLPVEELAGEAISEDRILRACLGTGATR
jgi:ribose transport system ATP-binding protein